MNRLLLGIFAAVAALFTSSSDEHVLTDLWKKYEVAQKADLPKTQLQVLDDIKAKSLKDRLMWDYYDACETSRSVTSSLNWKLRDSASTAFRNEIENYGDPSLCFYYYKMYGGVDLQQFVEQNASALKEVHTPELARRISWSGFPSDAYELRSFINDRISNDYEFALWTLWLSNNASGASKVEPSLRTCLDGKQPESDILDFLKIFRFTSNDKSEAAYQAYASDHKDEAVALLARQQLLSLKLASLERNNKGTSDDYKALRADCVQFNADAKKFSGIDGKLASCCTGATRLIKELDSEDLSFEIKDSHLTVVARNVKKVDFSLRQDGKTKYSAVLKNDVGSYYRRDTLRMDLPASLDDGTYDALCDYGGTDKTVETEYEKYTLSLALRDSNVGKCIYVADFKTGEPVYKADLTMISNETVVATCPAFSFVGFTPLPDNFVSKASNSRKSYVIRCSLKTADGRLRLSRDEYFNGAGNSSFSYSDASYATMITDCGAYNPGDVAKFKAIFYKGNPKDGYRVCEAGEKVQAVLYDAEYKKVTELSLKTGEFGSVAGEFSLPADRKGGSWHIEAVCGKADANRYFVVDEYVLPNFTLEFDKAEGFSFVGDRITVSGTVKAYSGHSLSGAKIRWSVSGEVDGESGSEIKIGDGGRFSFSFKAGKADVVYSQWYNINVTVVDATGETLEFSTSRYAIWGNISVSAELKDLLEGRFRLTEGKTNSELGIIDSNARLTFETRNQDGVIVPIDIRYEVSKGSQTVASGSVTSGEEIAVYLSKYASGVFTVKVACQALDQAGQAHKGEYSYTFLKVSDDAKYLEDSFSMYYRKMVGDGIRFQIGDSSAPLWAIIQLWGEDNRVLRAQTIHLTGAKGKVGSLATIDWEYLNSYPDNVVLSVFYFRDGTSTQYTLDYSRPVSKYTLPLSFTRFTDEARPSSTVEIAFRTSAEAECAATVFDKSTETIQSNVWRPVSLWFSEVSAPYVSTCCGSDGTVIFRPFLCYAESAASGSRKPLMKSSRNAVDMAVVDFDCVAEESVAASAALMDDAAEVDVRSDFKAALAFEPFIRPDKDGNAVLKFRTSDKLSSYVVQVFAHDKNMNSAAMRQEMLVTVPVKLSVVEPKYLFKGDRYVLNAAVASAAKTEVKGDVLVQIYDASEYAAVKGSEPVLTLVRKLGALAPGANADLSFDLSEAIAKVENLGIRLTFVGQPDAAGNTYSDAVFVSVPVFEAFQTLTEAHSGVLLAGMDRSALLAQLRSQFVNVQAEGAECKEISIIDMVREALPALQNPESENVFSLVDAYYSNALSAALDGPAKADSLSSVQASLMARILACRNCDGGFAWFKDMNSSPIVTAAVLGRFAGLRDRGLIELDVDVYSAAAEYLDRQQFDTKGKRPYWCGGLSMEQYLYARSLFADVKLAVKPSRAFRKEAAAYLVPKKARGLNGRILSKARRLKTLVNLLATEDGVSLASSLGVKLNAKAKISASVKADYASLYEYAQPHKNGGSYYPNAVMPFRGLLESEAYAHSLLCDLFKGTEYDSLADQIRLWLMLQKETQQWSSDPAYVEALASVLDGSDEVLVTKVILLSKRYRKPFEEIKAAGNGFTLDREYALIGSDGGTKALNDGDVLRVGDKVVASYRIWNEENRSFVRLSVPRPACLRPVDQLSGHYGWWMSPLRIAGWYSFSPQGYRWVRSASTEYWFDSYPEEKTTITETFYVTQEGVFTSPVAEIESLYAPHYRANADYDGLMSVKK